MLVNNFNVLTRFYYLRNQCSYYLQWLLLFIIIISNPSLALLKANLWFIQIIITRREYSHTTDTSRNGNSCPYK